VEVANTARRNKLNSKGRKSAEIKVGDGLDLKRSKRFMPFSMSSFSDITSENADIGELAGSNGDWIGANI
jgi:hypothetical protein